MAFYKAKTLGLLVCLIALAGCEGLAYQSQGLKCRFSVFGFWFHKTTSAAQNVYQECVTKNPNPDKPLLIFRRQGSQIANQITYYLALGGNPRDAVDLLRAGYGSGHFRSARFSPLSVGSPRGSLADQQFLNELMERYALIAKYPLHNINISKNARVYNKVGFMNLFKTVSKSETYINSKYKGEHTPLFVTALGLADRGAKLKIANILLDKGADPNLGKIKSGKKYSFNLLPLATWTKNEGLVKLLLKHNVNLNQVVCNRNSNKGFDTLTGIREGFFSTRGKKSPSVQRIEKLLAVANPNPLGNISNCLEYQQSIS